MQKRVSEGEAKESERGGGLDGSSYSDGKLHLFWPFL